MPTSDEQELKNIREKALDVAGYQHRGDTEIKAIDDKIAEIQSSIVSEQKLMANLQQTLNAERLNRRKILMSHISVELRE